MLDNKLINDLGDFKTELTINLSDENNYIYINHCSDYQEIRSFLSGSNSRKIGIGRIGDLDESNLKNILGNPSGFANFTQVEARLFSHHCVVLHAQALSIEYSKFAIGYIYYNHAKSVFTGWHNIN